MFSWVNILSFIWEILKEFHSKDKRPSNKPPSLKALLVFGVLVLSVLSNVFTIERLVTLSSNHLILIKRLKVSEEQVLSCKSQRNTEREVNKVLQQSLLKCIR